MGKRTDVLEFDSVVARHVKVDITALTDNPYLSISEIDVRDTTAGSLSVAGTLASEPNGEGKFDAEPAVALPATGAAGGEAKKLLPALWRWAATGTTTTAFVLVALLLMAAGSLALLRRRPAVDCHNL